MKLSSSYHDLDGASVFITGGGSGIGAALTEGFLRQGARVTFVQRSDGNPFCEEMSAATGNRPIYLPCDMTDVTQIRDAVAKSAEMQGPARILVSNAANDLRHDTLDVTEEFWDWCQAINLKSYFFAAQAVLPAMKAAGRGSIVNFTSVSYLMGATGMPGYTTANSGINGMTRSLAREFGPDGIRVNALAPGWVLTEKQQEKWATPEKLDAHMALMCLKEHLAPVDIVEPVLFLASDASRMMTGQALVVDGGVGVTG